MPALPINMASPKQTNKQTKTLHHQQLNISLQHLCEAVFSAWNLTWNQTKLARLWNMFFFFCRDFGRNNNPADSFHGGASVSSNFLSVPLCVGLAAPLPPRLHDSLSSLPAPFSFLVPLSLSFSSLLNASRLPSGANPVGNVSGKADYLSKRHDFFSGESSLTLD